MLPSAAEAFAGYDLYIILNVCEHAFILKISEEDEQLELRHV